MSLLDRKRKEEELQKKKRDRSNLNEDDLIDILNELWSKSSFGYPLPEQLRKPSGYAEVLYIQNQKKLAAQANHNQNDEDVASLLYPMREELENPILRRKRIKALLNYKFVNTRYRKDPLSEYEKLFA